MDQCMACGKEFESEGTESLEVCPDCLAEHTDTVHEPSEEGVG